MKNIFDAAARAELKMRIAALPIESEANWGEMNLFQMLRHCTENEKMLLRQKEFRRLFIGRLFGKIALKANLKDDAPLSKGSPTHPDLRIKGQGDVETEKNLWLKLVDTYSTQAPENYQDFIHPFFGKMNRQEVGRFAYKHIDHHLRQFGA